MSKMIAFLGSITESFNNNIINLNLQAMKKIMSWMLAAFCICGASAFTSCSNNDDNPVAGKSLAEKIVGKWIHADTDGEAVTTDMKSVYTFTKDGGSALKGFYSMSMTGRK